MEHTWTDDPSFENLELGAQCGNFGELYFPRCYLTDFESSLDTICNPFRLHLFCDAYNLHFWGANRFRWIIMCNPHGYGFEEDPEEAQRLLRELVRVIQDGGAIFVLGHERNKYCTPAYVLRNLDIFNGDDNEAYLELEESVVIDPEVQYPGFSFHTNLRQRTTRPNRRMIIRVVKS